MYIQSISSHWNTIFFVLIWPSLLKEHTGNQPQGISHLSAKKEH